MRSLGQFLVCIRKLGSLVLATLMLSVGLVATTFDRALAQAQPVLLTPAQVADIQAQVSAAITAANMQQFNTMVMDPTVVQLCNCTKPTPDQVSTMQCENPGRLAALAQAIATVTVNLIGVYGPQTAGDVTSDHTGDRHQCRRAAVCNRYRSLAGPPTKSRSPTTRQQS
jgi:hypothetical protein